MGYHTYEYHIVILMMWRLMFRKLLSHSLTHHVVYDAGLMPNQNHQPSSLDQVTSMDDKDNTVTDEQWSVVDGILGGLTGITSLCALFLDTALCAKRIRHARGFHSIPISYF